MGRVRDTLEVFRPEVFDIPLADLVAATGSKEYREANGVALGWYARWRLRRQVRSLLRPGTPPADVHAALVDAQTQRVAWQQMAGAGGRPEIPVDLDRARTAYESAAEELTWLGERLEPTAAGGSLLLTEIPDAAGAARGSGRPARAARPSSRACWAPSTPCALPAWARSSTTWPGAGCPPTTSRPSWSSSGGPRSRST